MKIAVVYVYPVPSNGAPFARLAERFVTSYRDNPPMMDHMMIAVSNGGLPNGQAYKQFSHIHATKFIHHDNSGYDIGAFQKAASFVICDLMVFFGSSAYFRGPGWLRRMVEAYQSLGSDGLFGCTGNQGDGKMRVWPHVRTTAFWCNPKLVKDHPNKITDNSKRYEWEHGATGLTSWVLAQGKGAWIVGWDCIKPLHDCNSLPGTFHNGDQRNVMVGDTLTHPPYYPTP